MMIIRLRTNQRSGDKGAKTKPSKYTKKFKQMYGERKLTDAEKNKLKKYEKDIDIKDFIDRYGEKEGKAIYYATLTKMAKKEGLWDNIRKKKERIARGSGERMRKLPRRALQLQTRLNGHRVKKTLNWMKGQYSKILETKFIT